MKIDHKVMLLTGLKYFIKVTLKEFNHIVYKGSLNSNNNFSGLIHEIRSQELSH